MYSELFHFGRRIVCQKSIWKDGELWTAILAGVGAFFWLDRDAAIIPKVRAHFGDLLNVTSIVFGFALAALIFYIEAAGAWAKDERVGRVADRIIDWHVWTLVCLLSLIGYLLALWAFGAYFAKYPRTWTAIHAVLVFQFVYCGGQILNHVLTVWWSFRNRNRLTPKEK